MRHPVLASASFTIPWGKQFWLPRAKYERPKRPYPSGLFYSQGCTWFQWGPVRLSIVWSNK